MNGTDRRPRDWMPLVFALVIVALDLLFRSVAAIGGDSPPAALLIPSLDAALLILMVCLFAWFRLPGAKPLGGVLAASGVFLLVFRAAGALVPRFFNRPLVLHTDITYVPDLYALLRDTSSPWLFYPGVGLLAVLLCALGYGLYRALGILRRAFAGPSYRYAFVGLVAFAGLLGLLGVIPFSGSSTLPRVVEALGGLAGRSAYLQEQQRYFETRSAGGTSIPGPAPGHPGEEPAVGLGRLGGRNVLLFIVESYGYALYSEPDHFEPIERDLRAYEQALGSAGFAVASAFLTSTAFGGNSWLADSTLATGLKIDNQTVYELLLTSQVKPLARYFSEAGYRTVVAMPATTSAWPEGDFFGFDKKYYYREFGYRGPSFKWAPMTDQYVLDVIHRREVAAADRPLFVQYVLISSHYPFSLIPHYFEDWSAIGDGSVYRREDAVTVVPIKPGSNTAGAQGYVAAMRYELELLTEYLTGFLARDDQALIVILGDHQPYSGISGRGAPWSVPIHVLSRDREVLEPFYRRGYTSGWIPRQPLPHPGLETFLPGLLEDFGFGPSGLTARGEDAAS